MLEVEEFLAGAGKNKALTRNKMLNMWPDYDNIVQMEKSMWDI